MDAFQLLKFIILENSLKSWELTFCAHNAIINWRQKYDSVDKKFENIESGIKINTLKTIRMEGKQLLKLEYPQELLSNQYELISVCSKLIQNEKSKHILMMNIHPINSIDLDQIITVIRKMTNYKFWILKTDRFYHVYTNEICDDQRWLEWNINFLMIDCIIVSPRYIGYSIRDGCNILRLNSTDIIKTCIPEVIYDSSQGFL